MDTPKQEKVNECRLIRTDELEVALLDDCDFGTIRNICKGRPVPENLRHECWQICLNVQGKTNALALFDGLYDLKEQSLIREECAAVVDKLGNDEEDKVALVSDLESIITFYCKSRNETFAKEDGWLEVIQPLLALKLSRDELYSCFYAIQNRYITRECGKNGRPFHLFRLLLLYHDPELCSFLDTKRITPEMYSQVWFRSLFASVCDLRVINKMWDVYFQHADQFLVFFLALVILINAKEQLLTDKMANKQDIVDVLTNFPGALEADDIEDFCSLAQYYATKTPQSFRRDYQDPLFGSTILGVRDVSDEQVSQALCLPVSVAELLQANQLGAGGDGVRYFVVDCRPAEQYNSGHLPTSFHLDANLMLQNPVEFNTAVEALFAMQRQAVESGSVSGGEHLCFMGSGREEEDQFVHMVVANFLQKGHQYISLARGGFAALHEDLSSDLSEGLRNHNHKHCIVCNPDIEGNTSDLESGDDFKKESIFGKLSNVMKNKSVEVKEKLTNYIKNEYIPPERHVSSTDKVGKRYRNTANVFSIGDDDEVDEGGYLASSDEDYHETVSLETWLSKKDVVYSCQCQTVDDNAFMYPSFLLVSSSHLFILREIPNNRGMATIQARRALGSIVKITSKKKHPEFITFKYGSNDDDGIHVSAIDRFIIPKAGDATKVVKTQIMKVLNALDS